MKKLGRRPWIVAIIGAAAVAVVVAIVVVVIQVNQANRVRNFVLEVRLNSTIVLNDALTDEQVGDMLEYQCRLVSEGWTRADVLDAAYTNWPGVAGTSAVSEAQWISNNVGLFDAARPNC